MLNKNCNVLKKLNSSVLLLEIMKRDRSQIVYLGSVFLSTAWP